MRTLIALLAFSFSAISAAEITIDGHSIKVFDPHVHPGSYSQMNPAGKTFVMGNIPDVAKLYAPATMELALQPYDPNLGISGQMEMASIDHAVLFATYTHHTAGYYTNQQLLEVLLDERNVSKNGIPTFVGLASINFDDFNDPEIASFRLSALASYFQHYPSLFAGIKLAHPHQRVQFDDPAYYGVYEVAATHQVPVFLHTGFSPFPGSSHDIKTYDPIYLIDIIKKYNGENDHPRVNFILAHAGQGDMRSVNHAIELCRDNDNVYLEISALDGHFRLDMSGNEISEKNQTEQLPYVLDEVKKFGLANRTLFATDGPQFSGMMKKYLEKFVKMTQAKGFSIAEIEQMLHTNTRNLLFSK